MPMTIRAAASDMAAKIAFKRACFGLQHRNTPSIARVPCPIQLLLICAFFALVIKNYFNTPDFLVHQCPASFPFDTVRPVQRLCIDVVKECLKKGQHLVMHAPTGLGKTAATLSPGIQYALSHNKTLFFSRQGIPSTSLLSILRSS